MVREIESDDLVWYCGARYGHFAGRPVRVASPDQPEVLCLDGLWRELEVVHVVYEDRDATELA